MLAIFNTIGQLVGGLCRDHTIAKGLSLKFATSGGLELEAQWAGGANLRDLLRRSRCITHGFTDEKALYTGSTWGQLVGGQSYSVSSALYRSVRLAEETSDVAFYRTTRVCSRSLSSVRP